MISEEKRAVFRADATLLGVAFIWGLGIPISADIVRTLSPIWGSALRMLVAAVFAIAIFWRQLAAAKRNDWKYGFIVGVIISCIFLLMGFALLFSTASKQAFIISLSVIMVPFLAWRISGKRPHNFVFVGAATATAGMLVMGFTPGILFNFGDFLSLIMCVFYAAQIIAIDYAVRRVDDPVTLVAIPLPIVALILTSSALVFEGLPTLTGLPVRVWGEIVFTGLFNTVLCFVLQTRAQRKTSASHAAIILSLESFFGYLIAVLSGQDPFILQGAVGGMLILAGVMLAELETILTKPDGQTL